VADSQIDAPPAREAKQLQRAKAQSEYFGHKAFAIVSPDGEERDAMKFQKTMGLTACPGRDDHLVSSLPQTPYDGIEKKHVGRVVDVDPDVSFIHLSYPHGYHVERLGV
jgi:hypothetical protein